MKSRRDYCPFGEEMGSNISGRTSGMGYGQADGLRQKFTQKERDSESGMDYFGARYYSSLQGRFTTPDDPFAGQDEDDPQTWNLYAYTSNNPLNRIDLDGERWFYRADDAGKVVDVQWVNPNDDGSYTSPGEGWIEFIPTKEKPYLKYETPDGHKVYYLGEDAEGAPEGRWLWTGKVETKAGHMIAAVFVARGGITGAIALFKNWRRVDRLRDAAKSVDDILENAAKGKYSKSQQYHKSGGFQQANKDFDALKPKNVRDRGNGLRTGELDDGTKVIVRPHSSGGKPTLELQPPKGQGPRTKVRYE